MSKYILSKSSKEIKNLDNNKYLFSNYKLSGRVLLYENLGKSKSVTISEKHKSNITPRISSATFKVHEGRGLIVAEIEIKEVYDDLKVQEFNCMISY
jgi:ribosomal protein S19